MFLPRLAVVRPLTVLMGLLGLVIMGAVSYTFLKIDRLPPISIPFVSVNMSYPGATAQDVELLITEPIENAVSGMSGVYSITSSSSEGSANVNVQLVDGTDPTTASLEVERRVNAIRSKLPADATDPRVNKAESDQIVHAMRKNDKDVEYYVFPDEGHGFARPTNNMAFQAAAENFLAKYLGGRAEPPSSAEAKLLESVKQ